MQYQSVEEICQVQGIAFVEAAYRALLHRPADPDGLKFYILRLQGGVAKQQVIAEIARSTEARKVAASDVKQARLVAAARGVGSWYAQSRRWVRGQTKSVISLHFRLEVLEERLADVESGLAYFGSRGSDEEAVLRYRSGRTAFDGEPVAHAAASGFSPRLGPAAARLLGRLAF
jgi:hypothetical protein